MINHMKWEEKKRKAVRQVLENEAYCSSEDTDTEEVEEQNGQEEGEGRTIRMRVCKTLRYESRTLRRIQKHLDKHYKIVKLAGDVRKMAPVRRSSKFSRRSLTE